jgi:hypothetical protein
MVFENYGVEKYCESHMESTTYRLRFYKYNEVDDQNESKLGLPVHTDKSFTTILHQNHVPGLEIQTKDGKWIRFEPSPSSFLFMAGDAFMVSVIDLFNKSSFIYIGLFILYSFYFLFLGLITHNN